MTKRIHFHLKLWQGHYWRGENMVTWRKITSVLWIIFLPNSCAFDAPGNFCILEGWSWPTAAFGLRRMQNNRGGWHSWAATRAIAATCVTRVDRAESCSAASVTNHVHKASTVWCPFTVIFLSSSTSETGFDLFIPGPGAVRLRPPLLAADNADNLRSCWSTGNFSNSFCTHLGTISAGNDR